MLTKQWRPSTTSTRCGSSLASSRSSTTLSRMRPILAGRATHSDQVRAQFMFINDFIVLTTQYHQALFLSLSSDSLSSSACQWYSKHSIATTVRSHFNPSKVFHFNKIVNCLLTLMISYHHLFLYVYAVLSTVSRAGWGCHVPVPGHEGPLPAAAGGRHAHVHRAGHTHFMWICHGMAW